VPTAFWNKEDPVHFSTFRNTVGLFDFVFTTDVDCVHRYKELLGHDRVYVLPFACQPAMHNPLEKYERKDALCFAGAYYARYPDRQRDFLGMLHELQEHWPIDIFDRNHGDTNPDYRFPEAYRHLIRGKLPFEQIDRAYKGYQYAINLNSIKFSQTMFARRVFEVLACNTVVVSNFSRGIRQLLGDLVIATDDPRSHVEWLRETTATPARLRKFKLAGLRKTLAEHTYQDRLGYVASKVFDIEPLVLLPEVMVVGAAHSRAEAENVRAAFDRQAYARKRLLLIAPEHVCRDLADAEGVAHLALEGSSQSPLTDHLGKSRYVASMVPDDYYGPQYLTDLALGSRYWSGRGIGKASHFEWRGSEPTLVDDGAQYKPAAVLQARAAIMASPAFAHVSVGEYVDRVTTFEIDGDDLVAIDEMSYCRDAGNRATEPSLVAAVDDPSNLDTGMSLPRLLAAAEEIEGKEDDGDETLRALAPAGLAKLFPAGQREAVVVVHDREGMTFDASLPADSHQYVHASRDIDLASLGFSETGKLFVDATLGLNMEVVLFFMDPAGARVSHVIAGVHTNLTVDIPPGTFSVRLAFRISGSGRATVSAVVLGHVSADEPARIFGRSDVLVLTNMYPSADALYQNAFVHRRVLEYARRGKRADIFCLRAGARLGYYEFDGVDVTRGGKHALQNVLRTRQHRTILVHFLDEAMWSVLEPHLDDLKVIVWLHGSEVQPWHRRTYNYTTPAQLEAAKIASERRVSFWQGILREPHPNFKLVFVSEYLAEEVQEDLGLRLPPDMFTVIHNLIDTELFSYQRKDPEQRKRILSIRPYASRKYANDLAVDAIVELSKEPFFDELEFRIIGDGLLFDETVEPLRDFRNVIIDKGFLTHAEIAALHKDYGVFLVPTRADTQGVSRDEAMASGLVPVTSAVTAVPEFVDEECGFMAPFDDASGLAAAIKTLYLEPDRFARMSAAAAARVRRQSTADLTAQRELELFRDPVR
jgi:glycosyltransferase involved in cell wall biosynthesis